MNTSSPSTWPKMPFSFSRRCLSSESKLASGSSGKAVLYSWHQRRALKRDAERPGSKESYLWLIRQLAACLVLDSRCSQHA